MPALVRFMMQNCKDVQ